MHLKDKAYKVIWLFLAFLCITPEAFVSASDNSLPDHLPDIQTDNSIAEDMPVYKDESQLELIQFGDDDFNEYYNDRQLKYSESNQPADTYLKKFLSFLYKVFRPVLENRATPILFYIAVIGATLLILVWFLRRNIEPVWQHEGPSGNIQHTVDEATLIDTDFDILLQQAIKAENYNNAVRCLFLQTLQKLVKMGFIKWEAEKTNYDYLKEVKDKIPGSSFTELLYIYEHCWYGNQLVDGNRFPQINAIFSSFQQNLNA